MSFGQRVRFVASNLEGLINYFGPRLGRDPKQLLQSTRNYQQGLILRDIIWAAWMYSHFIATGSAHDAAIHLKLAQQRIRSYERAYT